MRLLLKSLLAKLGYRVQGTRRYPRQLLEPKNLRTVEFDDVVCRRMFEFGSELTFIQVGAFDGITKDPLRKYISRCGWNGVVVEPQSGATNKLRDLYRGNDRIVILQAALDDKIGRRTLFTVSSSTAPDWAGGLASFRRDTIVKHCDLVPDLEAMIVEDAVDCITFDEVLEALQPKQIDLLQIDTEGADGHILSLFPLGRVRPAIIHWEVKHLSTAEREECLERLAGFGYRFAPSGDEDMLAVLDA
jgi:FkbM family methyltransferase